MPPEFLARSAATADQLATTGICVSVSGNEAAVTSAVAASDAAVPDGSELELAA